MAALRLEDLIKSQKALKEKEAMEQAPKEVMSMEEFKKLATEMGETNPGSTTKSLIKKGLTDKTGEGLNANVIKLTKVIKDAAVKKGNVVGANVAALDVTPASRVERATQEVDQARRVRMENQIGKYVPGGTGFLKEKFQVPQAMKGAEAFKTGFKGMFKLENLFDMSEGQSQGWLGQVLRRKVAKREFVNERMATEVASGRQVDTRANRKTFGKQFETIQKTTADFIGNKQERDRLQQMSEKYGDTPALRKKMAAAESEAERLDVKMAKSNLEYRNIKKADEAVPVNPMKAAPAEKASTAPVNPMKAATAEAEKAAIDETEAENLRTVGEQTETLKKIEENTSVLKNLTSKLAVPVAAAGAGPAATEPEGSFSLPNILPSRKMFSGLGKGLKTAGRFLGKAAVPLALATTAYEGVTGYNNAAENLDIKDREATFGEKMSSAGGSILSGLSFGLLDEKSTSKGIAKFFGAGPDKSAQATPVEKASVTFHQAKIVTDYQKEVAAGKLTPDQALTAVKQLSKDPETVAQAEKVFGGAKAAMVTPVIAAPQAADAVYAKSSENVAAAQKKPELGAAPVIVNAPTNVSNTSNFGPKAPARNTESSLQQYQRSKFAMSA